MSKLRLYVGCALKLAPPEFVRRVLVLKEQLRESFCVIDFHGFRKSEHNIYDYDMRQLHERSEAMLAICDEPSFGLGFEVATALRLEYRVLAVAHENAVVSGFVESMQEVERLFTFCRYSNLNEVIAIARRELLTTR